MTKNPFTWSPDTDALSPEMASIALLNKKMGDISSLSAWLPTIWDWITLKEGSKIKTYRGTTTSGTYIVYLTNDWTSSWTALFTEILHVNPVINDSTGNFATSHVISGDKKTCTITVTKLTQTGATILWITVVWSITVAAAPNGTGISLLVIAK